MRIYLTADGQSFWGPMDRDTAWQHVQSGVIPKQAKWVEARGQSHGTLRSEIAFFRPIGELWGEALDAVPDGLTTPPALGSDIPAGLRTSESAHTSPPSPPGVGLLEFMGGLWLFLAVVGALMIVWQFGTVGEGYGEELNVLAWAAAITSVLQGLLVFAVCRVLADVRVRLERLTSPEGATS